LVAAVQSFGAALRARHPVAWSGTWHAACCVRTRRGANFLGAESARLRALLRASGVAALNVAGFCARRAVSLLRMAASKASVLAIGESAPTFLFADAVVLAYDLVSFALAAVLALTLAGVSARAQRAAISGTFEEGACDVDVARNSNFVATNGNGPVDEYLALHLCRILILPARQFVGMVAASQLDVNIRDLDAAESITLTTAFVRTVVLATVFGSITRLRAVHSLVEAFRMAFVNTGMATRKALSAEKIASSLGRNRCEVIWESDFERRVGMTRAA
jgi:hypothetical protein